MYFLHLADKQDKHLGENFFACMYVCIYLISLLCGSTSVIFDLLSGSRQPVNAVIHLPNLSLFIYFLCYPQGHTYHLKAGLLQ